MKRHNKFHNTYELKFSIDDMQGVATARRHFGMSQIEPNYYYKCFESTLNYKDQQIACHYYWKLLSEEEKNSVYQNLTDYVDCRCPEIGIFLFTQANKEHKLQLLQDTSIFMYLLELQGLSIFNACILELSEFLSQESLMDILEACSYNKFIFSDKSFNVLKKYTRVFCTLLYLLMRKNLTSSHWNSLGDLIKRVTKKLLDIRETELAKMIFESMESENMVFEWMETDWIIKRFLQST